MIKLSSYIICKNEEASIKDAVMSLLHHVEEIIIVDTGSTDRTINIVKEISYSPRLNKVTWTELCKRIRAFGVNTYSQASQYGHLPNSLHLLALYKAHRHVQQQHHNSCVHEALT